MMTRRYHRHRVPCPRPAAARPGAARRAAAEPACPDSDDRVTVRRSPHCVTVPGTPGGRGPGPGAARRRVAAPDPSDLSQCRTVPDRVGMGPSWPESPGGNPAPRWTQLTPGSRVPASRRASDRESPG
eukprot:768188-Hanusia_phi.AAC.6